MYVSSIQSTSSMYFDMIRTTTRKTVVNEEGEKVKEIVQDTYRPYTNTGQLDSTSQTNRVVDIYA
jgi:hypothetical protein